MKTLAIILGTTLIVAAGTAHAAETQEAPQAAKQASTQAKHEGVGIIKKIDPKAHKIKLSHEAIPSLNWPAMTMWFVLKTPLPKNLKEGAEVRFEVKKAPRQKWAITHIERK